MNRHERCAAEAETRKGYEEYRRKVRGIYSKVSEREIGEGFMRGEALAASGADGMVIHRPGEPRPRGADDITVSVAYGTFAFRAYVAPWLVPGLLEPWKSIAAEAAEQGDPRQYTRGVIIECLVENRHADSEFAATLAGAIMWHAATSPVGAVLETPDHRHRDVHYEITDITAPDGHCSHNFRLMVQ
jgi:hypothetical protein